MVHRAFAVFISGLEVLISRYPHTGTLLLVCAMTVASAYGSAQSPTSTARPAPPAPDVYLASLAVSGGAMIIGPPLNITDRPGYDNQPAFTWDGSAILFTSVRGDGQADIYRYDIASSTTARVTMSAPESEYSATPIDSGRAISVVRVERDSTQRLWRFPLQGGSPTVILEHVKPVGYHAWADENTLALFVLGSPNSLQIANVRSGTVDTIARGIGRSLHRIPGTHNVSFVRKVSPTEWWIESLDISTRRASRLVQLPEGVEDYAWLPDGSIICGQGGAMLRWSGKPGEAWRPVTMQGTSVVKGITRIAVSPRGDRIAFVADGR